MKASKKTWSSTVSVSMGLSFAFAIKKAVEIIEEKRIGNVLFKPQIGYISI